MKGFIVFAAIMATWICITACLGGFLLLTWLIIGAFHGYEPVGQWILVMFPPGSTSVVLVILATAFTLCQAFLVDDQHERG